MKNIKVIILLLISLMLWNPIAVDATSNAIIDSNNAKEGIVRIAYSGISKKTKVMVEKGSDKYFYDLLKEEDFFPLQLGQGSYTVTVLENISGIEYEVIAERNFNAEIHEESSVYLKSTQPILWSEDMAAVRLAKSLAQGEESKKVVQAIYEYVINNVSYDYEKVDKLTSDYTPDIDEVIADGKGICYDYSVLLGAMLRSRGIPTKLVKGFRGDMEGYHAWNEVYLDGDWKVIDATYGAWAEKAGTSCQMFQDNNKYQKLKEY